MNPQPLEAQRPHGFAHWLQLHLPALLYAWFWLGMFVCGLLAPADRVAGLDSALVRQGWHLSVMCCVLGLPVLLLYLRRMRAVRRQADVSPTP